MGLTIPLENNSKQNTEPSRVYISSHHLEVGLTVQLIKCEMNLENSPRTKQNNQVYISAHHLEAGLTVQLDKRGMKPNTLVLILRHYREAGLTIRLDNDKWEL